MLVMIIAAAKFHHDCLSHHCAGVAEIDLGEKKEASDGDISDQDEVLRITSPRDNLIWRWRY